MNRVLRRWMPLLVVCLLLVGGWLASTLSAVQIEGWPVSPLRPAAAESGTVQPSASASASAEESATASLSPTDEVTEVDTPDETTGITVVLVLIVVLTIGGLVGWAIVRRRQAAERDEPVVVTRRQTPKPVERTRKAIVEAVDAGISELFDTDAEPRTAVIACWVRLESAAAEAGTPRRVGDSPTDLVSRLLYTHRVSSRTLEGLAAVYREARYATHDIDESMRVSAVEALRQLRAELGESPLSGSEGKAVASRRGTR